MFSKNTAQCPSQSSNPECLIRSPVQLPTNSTYGYWANNLLGQQTKLLGGGVPLMGNGHASHPSHARKTREALNLFFLYLFLTSDHEGHFTPLTSSHGYWANNLFTQQDQISREGEGWYHRWAMDNIPSRGGSNSLKSLVLQKPEIRIIIRIASFHHI